MTDEKVFVGFRAALSNDGRTWNVDFLFSDGTEEHDQYACDAVGTHEMLHQIGDLARRLTLTEKASELEEQ